MLKGLKSVDLKIIQMYNVSLPDKMEKIYGMHELVGLQLFLEWDSYFLPDGSPIHLFSKS